MSTISNGTTNIKTYFEKNKGVAEKTAKSLLYIGDGKFCYDSVERCIFANTIYKKQKKSAPQGRFFCNVCVSATPYRRPSKFEGGR